MLFEAEDVSVSRYIQRLRLQGCRNTLENPAFAQYTVSEIGYRHGFKDSSHFSRAFKAEFGVTPARCRRAHNS
ncbi:helix-turn-helix domain-containing protein [Kineobactrum salinum]|uniref:helix-turn-helix domain-containing protein n=1 Tax=Kineobactrum salinum TaxID=2708301 RepID=UPI0038CC0CBB